MESDRLFKVMNGMIGLFWWVVVANVFFTEGTMTMTERVWDVSDAETNRRLYCVTWLEQSSIQAWCTVKCKFSYKTTIVLLSERVAFYLPLAKYNNTDQQYWFVQLIKNAQRKHFKLTFSVLIVFWFGSIELSELLLNYLCIPQRLIYFMTFMEIFVVWVFQRGVFVR